MFIAATENEVELGLGLQRKDKTGEKMEKEKERQVLAPETVGVGKANKQMFTEVSGSLRTCPTGGNCRQLPGLS